MDKTSKIYVAGHRGLVGSALLRSLRDRGYSNLITRSSKELDLRRQSDTEAFFEQEKPEYVFLAAAIVGGILANSTYTAEFIYDNLTIATNAVHASYKSGVTKLLNLGTSCIYPKFSPQPMSEEYFLTGPLKPTNEAYAIAKITAIKLCRYYNEHYGTNFISVMPTNLYGQGDNFDPQTSHVLPAMVRKFHEAKKVRAPFVTIWGTGEPFREFLYVDDLADACIFLMERYNYKDIGEFINIGVGKDIKLNDLAQLIKRVVGYEGEIRHDLSKPDGTPRKLLDIKRMSGLGWIAKIGLEEGIKKSYEYFLQGKDA
jgi:GDP-L-fucose synthase